MIFKGRRKRSFFALNISLALYPMNDTKHLYTERRADFEKQVARFKERFFVLSMLRLAVFLLIVGAVYFCWGNTLLVTSSLLLGIIVFIALVSQSTNVKQRQKYAAQMQRIQEVELAGMKGDFSSIPNGQHYAHDLHFYNEDIDLFGPGSLFERINRTETQGGTNTLAAWLNSNSIDGIESKQELIQELKDKVDWRHHFKASAALIETDTSSDKVLSWLKDYKSFVPKFFKGVVVGFSILSVGIIVAYSLDFISEAYLLYWLILGLLVSGPYIKRITHLYNSANKMRDTLAQYAVLLQAIEEETFQTEALLKRQQAIQTKGTKASAHLRQLSKQIDYLGNRNNFIFAPIANGFFLWDIYYTLRIDAWFASNDAAVEVWFSTIEYFDAANSLANYAFNNPESVYPELVRDGSVVMEAKDLAHPLIKAEKVVRNDFQINSEEFFIVTGANMAGKSTFLRTVSLSIVMSNCGLPISAKQFRYTPVRLISSMRTSDSLQNDESYFFSELKRLKFIVDALSEQPYFIVLDEILKGTNSKDKAEGSWKFVERLLSTKSVGLIATHDLSLCELASTYPSVRNFCFDAQIINDELFFDYTLKNGVCTNMNASFLLRKMQIV